MHRSLVAAGCLASVAVAQLTTSCQWTSQGTSYDLSTMTVASTASYSVSDVRDPSTKYFFNVCGNAPTPTGSGCSSSVGGVTAWQTESSSSCYNLGSSASNGWNFTLFDPAYPDRGVVLTYGNGSGTWCPNNQPRTMSLELVCALVQPVPSSYTSASCREENTCSYRVQLPSLAGCPTQCLTGVAGAATLCNGNGVCGYNTDAKASQCYCYNGFSGATCGGAGETSSGVSVESILLIIVCIVLAGLLALVAFMVAKMRRLNVNPAAYAELQGRYNELGQMA